MEAQTVFSFSIDFVRIIFKFPDEVSFSSRNIPEVTHSFTHEIYGTSYSWNLFYLILWGEKSCYSLDQVN